MLPLAISPTASFTCITFVWWFPTFSFNLHPGVSVVPVSRLCPFYFFFLFSLLHPLMYACPSTVNTKIYVLFTATATQSDICTVSQAVSLLIRLPFAVVRFLHTYRNKWLVHHSGTWVAQNVVCAVKAKFAVQCFTDTERTIHAEKRIKLKTLQCIKRVNLIAHLFRTTIMS